MQTKYYIKDVALEFLNCVELIESWYHRKLVLYFHSFYYSISWSINSSINLINLLCYEFII